jgi:hypothetical protein
VRLRPGELAFVLAQGLPAVVEVRGASMTPALAVGERLTILPTPAAAVAAGGRDDIEVGDIVLVIAADADELLTHRVMHTFTDQGGRFVVHQGDMPGSRFAICARAAVIGKAVGFEADPARPLPTVARMSAAERVTFRRRAAAAVWYCRARRAARVLRLHDSRLARAGARLYRKLTGARAR